MPAELSPQGRAGLATWLMMTQGPMTPAELAAALGYRSRFSVRDLLDNLATAVPLAYDESSGAWRVDWDEDAPD